MKLYKRLIFYKNQAFHQLVSVHRIKRAPVYELELADNITVGSNDENDSEAALEIWTPIEGFYGIKANGKKITINKTGKVVVEAGAKINESVFVSGVAGMNVCKQFDKDENTTTYYLDYVRHNSSGSKTKSKTKEETEDNTMLNFCVDVKKGDACYDAVLWAYLNNICKGTDNVHFSPNATVNRAQAITFLWRAAGSPVVNYAMNMKDVDADSYYGEAVRWALSEGITKGISENQFGPDSTCTQVQIETLLARLANANDDKAGKEYIDIQKNPCTRADAVMYLYKQLAK